MIADDYHVGDVPESMRYNDFVGGCARGHCSRFWETTTLSTRRNMQAAVS